MLFILSINGRYFGSYGSQYSAIASLTLPYWQTDKGGSGGRQWPSGCLTQLLTLLADRLDLGAM